MDDGNTFRRSIVIKEQLAVLMICPNIKDKFVSSHFKVSMYNDRNRRRDSDSLQILFKNQNSSYLNRVQVNVQRLTVCRIFLGLGYSWLSTCVGDVRSDGVDSSSVADIEVHV